MLTMPRCCSVAASACYIAAVLAAKTSPRDLLGNHDDPLPSSPRPPNVIILFADNLGAHDVKNGNDSSTPNIATLARDGINLTNWNSVAHLCSASRAALLTGKYPIRTGTYPGVFKPDAANGLLPNETTLAEYLKDKGYATSIVGKWHLGHRDEFLPTNQGFDAWLGIPYHMSGGSIDNHTCAFDTSQTMWLPLYNNETIVQQPVNVQRLAAHYAQQVTRFIRRNSQQNHPFFLYMAFSHVHQLCAPRDLPEQTTCQWAGYGATGTTFSDAVQEMDWIAGQILKAIDDSNVRESTLVLFTSDNGPWVAEQSCSGQKGIYEGRWLKENVPLNCTACPLDYVPSIIPEEPRRCVLPGTTQSLQGVHCGDDSGLGSMWEANVRMPAMVRWPGKIPPGMQSDALVSTLDVVPTILALTGSQPGAIQTLGLDGIDISSILLDPATSELSQSDQRALFFWRDGFDEGPLPPPYGKFDVVAVKVGWIKVWYWTKSAHYNADHHVFHDPPLLFDTRSDPGEAHPLDPSKYRDLIELVHNLTVEHKSSVNWTYPGPLTISRHPKYIPCSNRATGCRTEDVNVEIEAE